MANNRGDEPLRRPIIASIILAVIFAFILFVQHIFNNELAILYQEIGEITKLGFSYVSSVIYLVFDLILAILMYAGLKDDLNDQLMYAIIAFLILLIPAFICCTTSSIYGLQHSPNNRVRILLAAPVSTILSSSIFLTLSALLSRKYKDEPKALPFILCFPLISLISGYFITFVLSFIPNYLVFINIYSLTSAALYLGSVIFLAFSHPVGEEIGFAVETIKEYQDYSANSVSSYDSTNDSINTLSNFILDDIAGHVKNEARPILSKASVDGASVKQDGSTLKIIVYLSFSFDSNYDEYDVKHIMERENNEICERASGIAKERLNYHDISCISKISVESSVEYSYYS